MTDPRGFPVASIQSLDRRYDMNGVLAKLKAWWQSRMSKPKV
jgi:hypothetical protein